MFRATRLAATTSPRNLSCMKSDVSSSVLTNASASAEEAEKVRDVYKKWGYLHAKTSPFLNNNSNSPLLDYLKDNNVSPDLQQEMGDVYCSDISVQYMHIPDTEKQTFITQLIQNPPVLSTYDKVRMAKVTLRSESVDKFLSLKFSNLKLYGCEGAEGMLVFCQRLFEECSSNKVEDVVIAMPHRGRISLLTECLEFPYDRLLHKYSGNYEYHSTEGGTGDVLSHLWTSVSLSQCDGVNVTLLPNPSHLEVASSVALGKVRAKMRDHSTEPFYGDNENYPLALLIHGDAAFVGQGISFENAQMSKLSGFNTHGSIHLITNNMIGFTSQMENRTSSFSVADIGKMYDVPVITVNGLNTDAINHAVTMAMKWRTRYKEDVIIDLQCYRLYGHNQHDEPRFTNPRMYKIVDELKSLPISLSEELLSKNAVEKNFIEFTKSTCSNELSDVFSKLTDNFQPQKTAFLKKWSGLRQANSALTTWLTGYPLPDLKYIGLKSVEIPHDFTPHPTLYRSHINKRIKMMETGEKIDWSMAESLAFGSLMMQGFNVRISGEDVPRGTFSHRHVALYDQVSEETITPINHIVSHQPSQVEAVNSLLSEEGVVGFEYGYSLENPNSLCLWEAQFGDFFNPAQVMYDQYVVTGECKWILQSGLVSLLPHGYDGNGPDHTSARPERWLQLSDSSETEADGDNVNVQIVNLTTPAQYFHVLRRQLVRPFRKPLVVMSPKGLLRSPDAVSTLVEFGDGTTFQRVLGDNSVNPSSVKRVLITSGKHYFTLRTKREELGDTSTAIIRIEELCPFPSQELQKELLKYNSAELVWCQEEARNQGAWSFVHPRVENILGIKLKYAGRPVCPAVAVGVSKWHKEEVKQILADAFSHVS